MPHAPPASSCGLHMVFDLAVCTPAHAHNTSHTSAADLPRTLIPSGSNQGYQVYRDAPVLFNDVIYPQMLEQDEQWWNFTQ